MSHKTFDVVLKFKREILGSKSLDPSIWLQHKIEQTRKSLDKWARSESKDKRALPFLDAAEISDEDVQQNLQSLRRTVEEYLGEPLSEEQWKNALANNLKKDSPLFQMLKEHRGHTVFARTPEGNPGIEDYVLKGAFKELSSIVCERSKKKLGFLNSKQFTASLLNRHMFIEFPGATDDSISPFWANKECTEVRDIERNPEGKGDNCSRSLRANTPQGPIVSIVASERVTPEVYVRFNVLSFIDDVSLEALERVLDVGRYFGCSQWRSAGKGRFTIERLEEI